MGDRWGPDGPPDEAYSRITRDLIEVTVGFADYLDQLQDRLITSYDCVVREPTPGELTRMAGSFDHRYAVQPAEPGAATLLVARSTYEGGAQASLWSGIAVAGDIPVCFCDACDEDSDSLIEQAEELVSVAVEGCREFRRPHVPAHGEMLHRGPWMEHGYEWRGGAACHASANVRGEPFSRVWSPWPGR